VYIALPENAERDGEDFSVQVTAIGQPFGLAASRIQFGGFKVFDKGTATQDGISRHKQEFPHYTSWTLSPFYLERRYFNTYRQRRYVTSNRIYYLVRKVKYPSVQRKASLLKRRYCGGKSRSRRR